MAGLGDIVSGLKRLQQQREGLLANLSEPLRLSLATPQASNPGELRMLTFVPPGLPEGAPLVVALHGCTQNAPAYDHGSGWSVLAERHGFAVLLPEQTRANNGQLCFNWFQPGDIAAGQGEAESIRQMAEQMVRTHRLDPRRVFITGLSAGGAMTAAVLATAPATFAGGAIIAGLPYGAATTMQQALSAMRQPAQRSARGWGDLVRAAADTPAHWPTVQIWQGDADHTVGPGNAEALALQWADVLGLPERPSLRERVDGAAHEAWSVSGGRPLLERWTVPGLGHGTPISSEGTDVDRSVGVPGPFMLESGINSTWHLARSWGLLTQPARTRQAGPRPSGPLGGGSVVERTLRKAGLLG